MQDITTGVLSNTSYQGMTVRADSEILYWSARLPIAIAIVMLASK